MAHPIEKYEFGGVDSRSNPFAMPENRSLRCLNWVPNPGGWLELSRGYKPVSMSGSIGEAIHSIADYQTLDSNGNPVRYWMVGAGTGVYSLKLSDGTLTKAGDLPSADKWGVFYANGQIHIGTKKGVWFWDGIKLRKSGIRSLTGAEAAMIRTNISAVVHSPTDEEIAAINVAPGESGGYIPGPSVNGGRELWMFYYDKVLQAFGCSAAIPQALGIPIPQVFTGEGNVNKLDITGLPNLSSINSNLVKIFALTNDGGSVAGVCLSSIMKEPSAIVSGTTLQFAISSGWVSVGDVVLIDFAADPDADPGDKTLNNLYAISAIVGGTNAQVVLPRVPNFTVTRGFITIARVCYAANAATTYSLLYKGAGAPQPPPGR